ncbi:MAG: VOC family protein [Acidimicrobiales bacterium]
MSDSTTLLAGVPVSDFGAAVEWYDRLFGRPADISVHESEVMWKVADAGWLYVVADAARAGHALVTLSVPDLADARTKLIGRGIEVGPIEAVGDAGWKAVAVDADGNMLSFIQVTN